MALQSGDGGTGGQRLLDHLAPRPAGAPDDRDVTRPRGRRPPSRGDALGHDHLPVPLPHSVPIGAPRWRDHPGHVRLTP